VYNGERYLRKTLDSLLSQTYPDFEVIISDNASSDGTQEVCEEYAARDRRIRYHRNGQNLGAARNFNCVFERSRGEYFKWAAHDDLCAPRFLSSCVQALEDDPNAVLSFSKMEVIDEDGRNLRQPEYEFDASSGEAHERFRAVVLRRHGCESVFGVVRASILEATPLIGNYIASDRVLLSELALRGRFQRVEEPLFLHRDHPGRSVKFLHLHAKATVWFDPNRAGEIPLPNVRLFFQHLSAIRRSPIGWGQRVRCYLHMMEWARVNRKRMRFDITGAIAERQRR
jgi:glycosyltransferase involved in cell wall biosynthesis